MGIYIFTHGINLGTGVDAAVINLANLMVEKTDNDVTLFTFKGEYRSYVHSQPTKFKLNSKVQVHAISDIVVDCYNKVEMKNTFVDTIETRHFMHNFTLYDKSVFSHIFKNINSDDFVIFTTPLLTQFLQKINVQVPCRSIVQVHGNLLELPFHTEALLNSSDVYSYVQVLTSGQADDYSKHININKDKIRVIPNICLTNFDVRNEMVEKENINIGVIGTHLDGKNQRAAYEILKKMSKKNVTLTFYGKSDTEYGKKLKRRATSFWNFKWKGKVRYVDFMENAKIFDEVDILLNPSKSEGFSLVLLEACKSGTPIVSYDFKYGPEDLVVDGYNGFVIDSNSENCIEEAAKKLDNLVDGKLRETMGNNCVQHYNDNFSLDITLGKYTELLPSLKKENKKFSSQNTPLLCTNIKFQKTDSTWKYSFDVLNFPESEAKEIFTMTKESKIKFLARVIEGGSVEIDFSDEIIFFLIKTKNGFSYLFNTNENGYPIIHSYYFDGMDLSDYQDIFTPIILKSNDTAVPVFGGRTVTKIVSDGTEVEFRGSYEKFKGVLLPCVLFSHAKGDYKIHYSDEVIGKEE